MDLPSPRLQKSGCARTFKLLSDFTRFAVGGAIEQPIAGHYQVLAASQSSHGSCTLARGTASHSSIRATHQPLRAVPRVDSPSESLPKQTCASLDHFHLHLLANTTAYLQTPLAPRSVSTRRICLSINCFRFLHTKWSSSLSTFQPNLFHHACHHRGRETDNLRATMEPFFTHADHCSG